MAKEVKQNFTTTHRSKSVSKPDSADSNGANSSSWGMSAIPPLPNGDHLNLDNSNSNNSSIQSEEYSEIEATVPKFKCGTPPRRSYFAQPQTRHFEDDPYGPMSIHFNKGGNHKPCGQQVKKIGRNWYKQLTKNAVNNDRKWYKKVTRKCQ